MKQALIFAVLIVLIGCWAAPAEAASGVQAPPRALPVTFQLQVAGQAPAGTTFWAAYGPVGGHFGIVQLHASSSPQFTAQRTLPAGRTVVAYLVGHGTIHTRLGVEPGGPVFTIRRLGPMDVSRISTSVVQWTAPVG